MWFKLMGLQIYGENGFAHVAYEIQTIDGDIESNEMLRIENEADRELLQALETFITNKRGDSN